MLADNLLAFLRLPVDYRERFVHYATIDRTAGEDRVRVLYISPEAIAALQASNSLSDDFLIVMEVYLAKRSPTGELIIDEHGRLVPDQLENVVVRTQLDDPQAQERVPESTRNGEWDYVTIDPATNRIGSVNNTACHACHVQAEGWEYTFTYPKLVQAAKSGQPQYDVCDKVGRQPCAVPGGP